MHVTTIGGGNGQSFFLKSLLLLRDTTHPEMYIHSIISMSDDGRTTGKLMCAYQKYLGAHLPPPGDLRRPLYVLSKTPLIKKLQDEMEYIYSDEREIQNVSLRQYLDEFESISTTQKSGLYQMLGDDSHKSLPIPESRSGYKRGNLLMAILFYLCDGDLQKTMSIMKELLCVCDDILPITQDKALIQGITDQGELVVSQDQISNHPDSYRGKILKVELTDDSKSAILNPEILTKTDTSSYIFITPGDIHTSLGSNFLPAGAKEWIQNHPAPVICVMNPVSKDGEARGLSTIEYIMILESYMGRKLDYIVANSTPQDWSAIADDISVKNGTPFIIDEKLVSLLASRGTKTILADLLDTTHLTYRYDVKKLATTLKKLLV